MFVPLPTSTKVLQVPPALLRVHGRAAQAEAKALARSAGGPPQEPPAEASDDVPAVEGGTRMFDTYLTLIYPLPSQSSAVDRWGRDRM